MRDKPGISLLPRLLLAALVAALALPAHAQRGRLGGMDPAAEGAVEAREGEVQATGLVPAFPAGYACAPIASPYASPTRYDGSRRRMDRFGGRHGGMDLSLAEGTPLLAVARGRLIAKGVGGQLEGIYLWLQHAPADTGLALWAYTKYQHLAELSALNEGDTVEAGQPVGKSGRTGTIGGHYGAAGYPHLHLSVFLGPSAEFMKAGMYGSMVRARGAAMADPLALYLKEAPDPAALAALPEEKQRVPIPVAGEDGTIRPAGSRVVWPVACQRSGPP